MPFKTKDLVAKIERSEGRRLMVCEDVTCGNLSPCPAESGCGEPSNCPEASGCQAPSNCQPISDCPDTHQIIVPSPDHLQTLREALIARLQVTGPRTEAGAR